MSATIINEHCLSALRKMEPESVHCCVTSPPYWGLRDYGCKGQIGQEKTPELFVAALLDIFREVKRVLRKDGTCWINLGDSYAGSGQGFGDTGTNKSNSASRGVRIGSTHGESGHTSGVKPPPGLKAKDLIGIPWRVAFALQADGWWLRSDIIWAKRNCMPESVTDRPTRSHEYLFLLSKSSRYFYDHEAIKESSLYPDDDRKPYAPGQVDKRGNGHDRGGGTRKSEKQRGHARTHEGFTNRWDAMDKTEQCSGMRNKRDVWTVASASYPDAHFATFPPDLIKPCVLAGCPVGGTVLDPFAGSGTTGEVAMELGRNAVLIELNPDYCKLIEQRLARLTPGLALK